MSAYVPLWNGMKLTATTDAHRYHLLSPTLWDFNTPSVARVNNHGFPNFSVNTGALGCRSRGVQCRRGPNGFEDDPSDGKTNPVTEPEEGGPPVLEFVEKGTMTDPSARLQQANRTIEQLKNEISSQLQTSTSREDQLKEIILLKEQQALKLVKDATEDFKLKLKNVESKVKAQKAEIDELVMKNKEREEMSQDVDKIRKQSDEALDYAHRETAMIQRKLDAAESKMSDMDDIIAEHEKNVADKDQEITMLKEKIGVLTGELEQEREKGLNSTSKGVRFLGSSGEIMGGDENESSDQQQQLLDSQNLAGSMRGRRKSTQAKASKQDIEKLHRTIDEQQETIDANKKALQEWEETVVSQKKNYAAVMEKYNAALSELQLFREAAQNSSGGGAGGGGGASLEETVLANKKIAELEKALGESQRYNQEVQLTRTLAEEALQTNREVSVSILSHVRAMLIACDVQPAGLLPEWDVTALKAQQQAQLATSTTSSFMASPPASPTRLKNGAAANTSSPNYIPEATRVLDILNQWLIQNEGVVKLTCGSAYKGKNVTREFKVPSMIGRRQTALSKRHETDITAQANLAKQISELNSVRDIPLMEFDDGDRQELEKAEEVLLRHGLCVAPSSLHSPVGQVLHHHDHQHRHRRGPPPGGVLRRITSSPLAALQPQYPVIMTAGTSSPSPSNHNHKISRNAVQVLGPEVAKALALHTPVGLQLRLHVDKSHNNNNNNSNTLMSPGSPKALFAPSPRRV